MLELFTTILQDNFQAEILRFDFTISIVDHSLGSVGPVNRADKEGKVNVIVSIY
jgi:hypothetical protein